MIEAGIVDYGEKFIESMEKGSWDLSKVDKKKLKDSKAAFVFDKMNLLEQEQELRYPGLTSAEYFRDGDGKGQEEIFFSLLIIFSGLLKLIRGISTSWKDAFCSWISTYFSY